jgi:hypothetical protein
MLAAQRGIPKTDICKSVPDLQTLKKEITIVINEDQPEITASFIVPEYLLIGGPEGGGSEYFKAACRGEWKEASSRVIKLQEIDTEAFNSYVFWIHKDKVATNTDIGMEGVPHEKAAYPLMEKLVNLWLLGDRLADTKFRNEIMDATIGVIHGLEVVSDEQDPVFSAATTVLIWSNTTDGRALRRLVVDHYIHMVTLEEMRPQWDEFHPRFHQGSGHARPEMQSLRRSQRRGGRSIHAESLPLPRA